MNKEAQEILNKILNIDPDSLSTDEIEFLRARRDYLKKAQLEEYASILTPKVKSQTSEKTETVKTNDKPQKTN